MSTYLLLRNNKETGPFSIEDIKGMSLKTYDLLWVVGKSAAWRYPGEISELKSFAPALPEKPEDLFLKTKNTENPATEPLPYKKVESANAKAREGNPQRTFQTHSVYVNLPAEKKPSVVSPAGVLYDSDFYSGPGPTSNFSYPYNEKPSRSVRYTGKILWIGTIILLFGTGILTGLFISDRRNFFSADANHPQNVKSSLTVSPSAKKEILPAVSGLGSATGNDISNNHLSFQADSLSAKTVNTTRKKNPKNTVKKDSATVPATVFPGVPESDSSLTRNFISKTEILYHKIKAHPENYIDLVTGKYTTGLFGGISAIPVTITNNAPEMMDLVIVDVLYIQNNDKVYKTEKLSFNDLEPGETVTVKAPKSPRGTKIVTRIHQMNSRKMDLNYSN